MAVPVTDPDTGEIFWLRGSDAYSEEIRATYADRCAHDRRGLRRRVSKNGRVSFWLQCLDCGAFPSGAVPKDSIADPAAVADEEPGLRQRWFDQRERQRMEIVRKYVRMQKQENANWWRWYDGYLKSPAWIQKRNLVLARANHFCEGCGTRRATQVHHKTYDNVGNEFLFELVAVCDACHDRIHDQRQQQEVA
jgi:hypothetical protein